MYQEITIVGNLGGDPQMRYMPDGTAVTNFSVAVNRKWKDQASGELVEEVAWFRVSVWGKNAENCNRYLNKGRQVMVKGRLNVDPQTGGPKLFTRQDGSVGASYEITAHRVLFLAGGDEREAAPAGNGASSGKQNIIEEEDDIPF